MSSGKPCIFLCDDDRDIVEVTRLILEQQYDVKVFYTCDEILETAREIQPAAIILDLWMPGEGGEAIAKKLKKDPSTSHIPIVLFSASNSLGKIASSIKVDACIAKPYDIDELLSIVERCISAAASA